MTRYDRKKMIERMILDGKSLCIKCSKDVAEGFTSVDDIIDVVETRKVDNMLPKSVKNCTLVHIDCIKSMARATAPVIEDTDEDEEPLEKIVHILSKGPIGGWQQCYHCKKDLTGLSIEDIGGLVIYRVRKNSPQYLVHPSCVKE